MELRGSNGSRLTRSRRTHLAFYRTLRKAPLRNGIRCIVARM
nr:MAG TPA: hypothetical protein [Caudoviricetes sp.]